MAGLEGQLQAAAAALLESRARASEQTADEASAAAAAAVLQGRLDALTEQVPSSCVAAQQSQSGQEVNHSIVINSHPKPVSIHASFTTDV